MGKQHHNRNLGLSARSRHEIDQHEQSFLAALAREESFFRQRSQHYPKATIDIAVATSTDGRSAYGAVIHTAQGSYELSLLTDTTPQRTTLMAAEASLASLLTPHSITLASTSGYLVESMAEGHVRKWSRNGWQTTTGAPVKSRDLWLSILRLGERHAVKFQFKVSAAMERAKALAAKALPKAAAASHPDRKTKGASAM